MKTLLLSIPIGMSVRNILRSDIFRILLKYCRIIIFSPYSEDQYFQKEFAAPNVDFVSFSELNTFPGHARLLNAYIKINYWGFWLEKRPQTVEKYTQRLLQERGQKVYSCWVNTARLWNTLRKCSLLRGAVERILINIPSFKKLCRRFRVDAVLTVTHDVMHDIILMAEAKRQGLPVAVMVHSWDGLPSRGRMFISPDRLLVWNKIMLEQARELHHIPQERIYVTGIPQYDNYLELPRMPRPDYLRQLRVEDPRTKLVTYTCVAQRVMPDEPEFINQLIEIVEGDTWGKAILVLRLHPTERREQYRKQFGEKTCIQISEPDSSFSATLAKSPILDGRSEFVNLMAHSDVVINLASTTTIDAVLFDTPVVNIAYNPALSPNKWNKAKGWYLSSHFKYIVASGGTRLARSREELIKHVANYLANPKLDADGREQIRREQCYKLDGQASRTIVKCVLDMMKVPNNLLETVRA